MRRRKRERKEGEEEVKERERGREGRRERGGRVGGERKGRQVTEPDGSGVIWFNPETKKNRSHYTTKLLLTHFQVMFTQAWHISRCSII